MNSIRLISSLDELASEATPARVTKAAPQVTPQVAPSIDPRQDAERAPLLSLRQHAAVAPRPEYPDHPTADSYISMRCAEATAALTWPTGWSSAGYEELKVAHERPVEGHGKPTVCRLWVEGQSPPPDPPTAAEHAWQFLTWLQGQSSAAGHLV
jgi:hypothetical protein